MSLGSSQVETMAVSQSTPSQFLSYPTDPVPLRQQDDGSVANV